MNQLVGKKAPAFEAKGVLHGKIDNYQLPHTDGKWTILLFYPLDFTFVCPTEVTAFSDAHTRFEEIGAQVYGISVDSEYAHLAWTEIPREKGGVGDIAYPLLADVNKHVASQYGVLLENGVALRGLFVIDDEGTIQHATINNLGVGRSVEETLRLIQAFQYTKKHGEVCPANWTPGKTAMKPSPTGLREYAKALQA